MSETNVGISPEQNDALMGKLETVEKMLSERMANEEFEKFIGERIDKLEGVVENIIKAMDEKKKYEEEEGEEKGEGEEDEDDGGEKVAKAVAEAIKPLRDELEAIKKTPFMKGIKEDFKSEADESDYPGLTFNKALAATYGIVEKKEE